METPARLDQREFFHPDCKVNPLLLDEVLSFVQPSNLILSKKIKGKWSLGLPKGEETFKV